MTLREALKIDLHCFLFFYLYFTYIHVIPLLFSCCHELSRIPGIEGIDLSPKAVGPFQNKKLAFRERGLRVIANNANLSPK